MMNLDQVVHNFINQNTTLGYRISKAMEYRDAQSRGDISSAEYQELIADLQRLDNIQLSADELDQQIAFNECLEMLKNLPIS